MLVISIQRQHSLISKFHKTIDYTVFIKIIFRIVHGEDFDNFDSYKMADPWIVSENSNLTHLEIDGHLKGKAILIYASNVYMDPLFSGNGIWRVIKRDKVHPSRAKPE